MKPRHNGNFELILVQHSTMNYKEFKPGVRLKDYVQCYFICETETAMLSEDKIFATGFVEIMFNLGNTRMQTVVNNELVPEPFVQLWGQTVQPITRNSFGKHAMLGIRFFSHTACCFLNDSIEQFNDRLIDLEDVAGNTIKQLHEQLFESPSLQTRIALLDNFLLQQLSLYEKRNSKVQLLNNILQELKQDDFFDNISNLASRYGISSRYLQKIFIRYTGLTPNLFTKINRFNKSLQLVAKKRSSLTSIAHQCGYFDQSHFIKDFRYFTGATPSALEPASSSELLALLQH
jgi:AraC-like DNA-binding protein